MPLDLSWTFSALVYSLGVSRTTSWLLGQLLLCYCYFALITCLLISSWTIFQQIIFTSTNMTFPLRESFVALCAVLCPEVLALLLFCWCCTDLLQEPRQSLLVGSGQDKVSLLAVDTGNTSRSLLIIWSIMFNLTGCWFASSSASVQFSQCSRSSGLIS